MNKIEQIIHDKGYALADGAIGTNLFAKGLMTGDAPELWNLEQPEKITELHQEFVTAGSDIILTNSFGGTEFRMKLHQAESQVDEINIAAANIARSVADSAERLIVVGGSIGPTGELFEPLGSLDEASAIAAFSKQAQALADGGADVIWIETMSSREEMQAAIKGASTANLPIYATMTFDTAGRTMMGIQPVEFADEASALGLSGFGANCGIGPAELLDTVFGFCDTDKTMPAIIAKGNCGIPAYVEGAIHYHGTPDLMADYAIAAYRAGAEIIGGCCGTTAEHIKAMAQALAANDKPKGLTREAAAMLLGKPWADVPQAPSGGGAKRNRRRRTTS